MSDPFRVLGVSPQTSDEEIAKAYKKLAKKYHPDLNPGNEAAAQTMGRINQAYDEIKMLRQSGDRMNSTPGYQNAGAAYGSYGDPYEFYARAYQQYQRQTQQSRDYQRRRAAPFRLVFVLVFVYIILRLVGVILLGTTPVQNYLYKDTSQEPYYSYSYRIWP